MEYSRKCFSLLDNMDVIYRITTIFEVWNRHYHYYHIESFQTPYDTSDNVCRDLQN